MAPPKYAEFDVCTAGFEKRHKRERKCDDVPCRRSSLLCSLPSRYYYCKCIHQQPVCIPTWTPEPIKKIKNNRSINQISTHPVMMGNSRCRSVSRLVLSCQWGDLQVTQSVCRAGEETAEDGDGVRVSTPAFSTVTRCALQRPHRCFTWEIVASFYNQATISHYRLL